MVNMYLFLKAIQKKTTAKIIINYFTSSLVYFSTYPDKCSYLKHDKIIKTIWNVL